MSPAEDLDDFIALVSGKNVRLHVESVGAPLRIPGKVDAIFHLPLLSVAIIVAVKMGQVHSFSVGRCVARLLVEHFGQLRTASNILEWSITLRRRCAEALAFLEATSLVRFDETSRRIDLSAEGKALLARGLRNRNDVGQLVRGLVRSQSRVIQRGGQ